MWEKTMGRHCDAIREVVLGLLCISIILLQAYDTRFTYDGADEIVGAAETVGLFVGVTDG